MSGRIFCNLSGTASVICTRLKESFETGVFVSKRLILFYSLEMKARTEDKMTQDNTKLRDVAVRIREMRDICGFTEAEMAEKTEEIGRASCRERV